MVSGWASNTCKHLQIENMKTDTVHLWDVESIKFLLQQLKKNMKLRRSLFSFFLVQVSSLNASILSLGLKWF